MSGAEYNPFARPLPGGRADVKRVGSGCRTLPRRTSSRVRYGTILGFGFGFVIGFIADAQSQPAVKVLVLFERRYNVIAVPMLAV